MGETRREVHYASKRVDKLEVGDVTPWYAVRADAQEDTTIEGWFSVRVFHFASEHDGWVHQRGSDEVPVELKDGPSPVEETLHPSTTHRG